MSLRDPEVAERLRGGGKNDSAQLPAFAISRWSRSQENSSRRLAKWKRGLPQLPRHQVRIRHVFATASQHFAAKAFQGRCTVALVRGFVGGLDRRLLPRLTYDSIQLGKYPDLWSIFNQVFDCAPKARGAPVIAAPRRRRGMNPASDSDQECRGLTGIVNKLLLFHQDDWFLVVRLPYGDRLRFDGEQSTHLWHAAGAAVGFIVFIS